MQLLKLNYTFKSCVIHLLCTLPRTMRFRSCKHLFREERLAVFYYLIIHNLIVVKTRQGFIDDLNENVQEIRCKT